MQIVHPAAVQSVSLRDVFITWPWDAALSKIRTGLFQRCSVLSAFARQRLSLPLLCWILWVSFNSDYGQLWKMIKTTCWNDWGLNHSRQQNHLVSGTVLRDGRKSCERPSQTSLQQIWDFMVWMFWEKCSKHLCCLRPAEMHTLTDYDTPCMLRI